MPPVHTGGEAMPVHDWSKATPGDFHDFHVAWLSSVRRVLNGGLLPGDYYASVEQHVQGFIPDVTTLHAVAPAGRGRSVGGALLAEPRRRPTVETATHPQLRRERVVAVRRAGEAELVAVVEVISAGNKSSRAGLEATLHKATDFLRRGVNLVVLDVIPPGRLAPSGLHAAIWEEFTDQKLPPPAKPLATAAYHAAAVLRAYVQELAPGDVFDDVPLFLRDGCVEMPMEAIYTTAFGELGFPIQDLLQPPS